MRFVVWIVCILACAVQLSVAQDDAIDGSTNASGQNACGDGVQEEPEECDDGVANSDFIPDACRTNCALPSCGDNVRDSGEACDDGASNSAAAPDACRNDCALPACGDGFTDMGEECDDGNTDDGDGCNATCQNECGNGVQEWNQIASLVTVDATAGDPSATAVASSSDTVVVGVHWDDDAGTDSGSAYVFARNAGGADAWGQIAKLTASDGYRDDMFGRSVSVSGDMVVVGAPGKDGAGSDSGSAYVFQRDAGGADAWGQVAKLVASDRAADDFFGYSVSVSGDTVVVGALSNDDAGSNSGSAYVFERHAGGADAWSQVAKLTASDAGADDRFGVSVAVGDDAIVVGALLDDHAGYRSGSAYVFERDMNGAGAWGQVAKLTASDAAALDHFARSVSVSGDTAVVGSAGSPGYFPTAGSAYVFERDVGGAAAWGQVAKLTGSDPAHVDFFGGSVSASGDRVVVGAYADDDAGLSSGSAYVFERNAGGAGAWGQVVKRTASDARRGAGFGSSVSVGADVVAVGALLHHDATGSAYILSLGCATCGDATRDAPEECDDGVANSDTLPDACRTDCTLPACGDHVTDSGEDCDDGAGNSDIARDACRTDCTLPACGDGTLDSGEECDDGNAVDDDGCNTSCQSDCGTPGDDAESCLGTCESPGAVGEVLSIHGSLRLAANWNGHELTALTADEGFNFYWYSDLCLYRYDPEGVSIAENCHGVEVGTRSIELASSGSGYLLAAAGRIWDSGDEHLTYVRKLDSEGNPLADLLTVPGPGRTSHAPAILWTGREHVLAWGDDSLWFARIDEAAERVLDSRRIATSGDPDNAVQPSLVPTGDGYLVGWKDHLLRLDPWGTVLDGRVYAPGAFGPALVTTSTGFALAWVDNQPEAPGLYFSQLTPTGEPVGTPTRLTSSPSDGAPLVAWTGSEFGVAHEARFFRIDSAGGVIGAPPALPYPLAAPRNQGLIWTGAAYALTGLDSEFEPVRHLSLLSCDCPDSDGDGVSACIECDDANAAVYPLAPPACDGFNNDCLSPSYPELVGTTEFDDDQDGLSECEGDCNDRSVHTYAGAVEACDGFDNDCDGNIDNGNCDTTCDGLDLIGSSSFPYLSSTRLIWNGVGYGFLERVPAEVYAYEIRFVDSAGSVLTHSLLPWPITPPGGFPGYSSPAPLAVSWNGSEFVVGDDELVFVTPSGDFRRVHFTPATLPGPSLVNFVSDGNDGFFVSWTREYDGNYYVARLDAAGELMGSIQRTAGLVEWIGIVPSTTEYAVVSRDGPDFTFQRFTESWEPLGEPFAFASYGCEDVFWTGDAYGVLCADGSLTRLDPTGVPLGEPVALGAESMVWNGTEYGALVGAGFRRFDSAGNELGGIDDLQGCHPDEIVWNGTEYAILGMWNDGPCFVRIGCNCFDGDGDGFSACVECDDLRPEIYPGALQICDAYNNDCDAADWPAVHPDEADLDADGFSICEGDCDDANDAVHPAAPELCDGLANDCIAPGWPQLPASEADADGDGFSSCENDCDDSDRLVHPASPESCNAIDDNCNLLVDEDDAGEDSDLDGVRNVCDNCRFEFNVKQVDSDDDEAGNACDNCAFDYNPWQSNLDEDLEGDLCDLDDDMIYVTPSGTHRIDWQAETGYASWNVYRGDLGVLKATATYTQAPGSSYLADWECGLEQVFTDDLIVPAEGEAAFYLVSGVAGGVEGGLGQNSTGAIRPNASPCP